MPHTAEAAPNVTMTPTPSQAEPSAVTRLDPITGRCTIFAPQRGERPDQFTAVPSSPTDTSIGCPFCRGSESQTPHPVWIGRKAVTSNGVSPNVMPSTASISHQAALARKTSLAHAQCIDDPQQLLQCNDSDWLVRVVPNKFPAISRIASTAPVESPKPSPRRSKLFAEAPVLGGHEVIIESPTHHESITALGTSQLSLVLAAFRDRIGYWQSVKSIAYISAFKNCGGDAGASLAHSHSQIIATDSMPAAVRDLINRKAKYRAETGCCLQCDLIRAEVKEKSRIIANSGPLIAFCPFASPMPMSVRITTKQHLDRFDQLSDELIESVARLLKRVASWIEQLLPGKAYNVVLHTRPPAATGSANSYHWTLEVLPRLSRIAGFEFGSQCMINSVMPEDAASKYRQCAASEDPRAIH